VSASLVVSQVGDVLPKHLLEGFGNGRLGGWSVALPQLIDNLLQLSGHVGTLQGRANSPGRPALMISIGKASTTIAGRPSRFTSPRRVVAEMRRPGYGDGE
jgi:hypothetical protein